MLTKKQFLKRLNFIKEYETRMNEFDQALQKFAKSDFTGFYDEKTFSFLCDCLAEDMDDKYEIIPAWMFDMEWGTSLTEIYDPENDNKVIANLNSPEALYDYLFIEYAKAPPKEQMRAVVKAQDNGVKFALATLTDIQDTNENTHNPDWETRDSLIQYVKDRIEDDYLMERGVGADLDLNKELDIISVLEDES